MVFLSCFAFCALSPGITSRVYIVTSAYILFFLQMTYQYFAVEFVEPAEVFKKIPGQLLFRLLCNRINIKQKVCGLPV